jgi:hypothetical protein
MVIEKEHATSIVKEAVILAHRFIAVDEKSQHAYTSVAGGKR